MVAPHHGISATDAAGLSIDSPTCGSVFTVDFQGPFWSSRPQYRVTRTSWTIFCWHICGILFLLAFRARAAFIRISRFGPNLFLMNGVEKLGLTKSDFSHTEAEMRVNRVKRISPAQVDLRLAYVGPICQNFVKISSWGWSRLTSAGPIGIGLL